MVKTLRSASSAALALVGLLVMPVTFAQEVAYDDDVPVRLYVGNPCNGEIVRAEGQVQLLGHIVPANMQRRGNDRYFYGAVNFRKVEGMGLTTGHVYQARVISPPIKYFEVTPPLSGTFRQVILFDGPGQQDFHLDLTAHVTKLPSGGLMVHPNNMASVCASPS